MPQPQKYERSRDFTKQEAHKTDHAGINAELDNAATTIDALRVRQALLLNDQDQLRAKLIQRVNLSDGVIEDITSGVASGLRESVESAQSAARASLTFAEDATTQAAQALRSATQAQTTLDAAAITVAQAQAAMRDAGDVLGFVQQHAAATDPHAAAGYVKQQQIDSSLADHQQATDPHPAYAPLASPALTGTPTAPTATPGTDDTQIATTEFVQGEKPAVATQAEMEAGTESGVRSMSPLNVAQAIEAKSSGGIRGQVFTSSGTFTVPTGVTSVKVRGCGGGGGSGGGGSNTGGTTSFGSYCSATGGINGHIGSTGGVATGGNINIGGGARTTASGGLCGGSGLFGGSASSAPTTGYGNGGFSSGNSGGGGGYFERYITGLTPGDTIAVTVGAGGWAPTNGAAGVTGICIVEW